MSAVEDEISRRGAPTLEGVVLTTNRGMLDFVQRLGFRVEPGEIPPLFRRVVESFCSGLRAVLGSNQRAERPGLAPRRPSTSPYGLKL